MELKRRWDSAVFIFHSGFVSFICIVCCEKSCVFAHPKNCTVYYCIDSCIVCLCYNKTIVLVCKFAKIKYKKFTAVYAWSFSLKVLCSVCVMVYKYMLYMWRQYDREWWALSSSLRCSLVEVYLLTESSSVSYIGIYSS